MTPLQEMKTINKIIKNKYYLKKFYYIRYNKMFSDCIHNSYMEIYNGIRDYNEYCETQKERTIKAMINLFCIMTSFNMKNSTYEITLEKTPELYNKIKNLVLDDYKRAMNNEPYY